MSWKSCVIGGGYKVYGIIFLNNNIKGGVSMETSLLNLGIKLASYVGKSSVQSIQNRIRRAKAESDKDDTINQLDEIISELIQEKSELITLAQAYDEQLLMRKISDDEVEYITEGIVPIIEKLIEKSEGIDSKEFNEIMEVIKPLLSKDTFNILQMLGFNFKEAIGDPLTKLVGDAITSQSPKKKDKEIDLSILNKQAEVAFATIIQDEQAYQRYLDMTNKK